jgi:hypothetical protein
LRRKLIDWSLMGGVFITEVGLAFRFSGIPLPARYLTYFGSYLMQVFFQGFLQRIPWKYADNFVSEFVLFFAFNALGYAFVIFLLLRIFFPDRAELRPLSGQETDTKA